MNTAASPDSSRNPDDPHSGDPRGLRLPILITGATVVGAIVFYLGMIMGASADIPANTTVLGVQIGGMSRAEAVATLERDLAPRSSAPLAISAYDTTEEIFPGDAGLSFDPVATVDAAAGRLYNPASLLMRVFGPASVDPVVVVDEAVLAARIEGFAEMVSASPVEPTLHYEQLAPILTLGEDGRGIDVPAAANEVADAYMVASDSIALPQVVTPPTVSNESAEGTRDGLASTAVSAPVTIEVESVRPQIPPESIAEATHYIVEEGELRPQIDGALLHEVIAGELETVETRGNNATFEIDDDNVPYVVPSRVGRGVSDEDLAAAVMTAMAQEGDARVAPAPVTVRDPTLTTEKAATLGVIEEVSSFTQQVNYAEYMAHNLALASEYINGTLLMPGEVFSMNKKTENHDPVNGYMEGYVIGPGGVFQKALGGGLSAATTTVWSAAFYAGLEPVEVQAHSIYISRYVPGLEATVAWEGFDMKFRNNTPYGIYISAYSDETSMTVRMYSTRMYTDITAEVGDRYGITDYKTIYNDSQECSAQTGGEGFTIDVDRLFYEGDTVVNEETFTTSYVPAPQVVCGKKPKPEKPEDGGSESPSPEPTDVPTDTPTEDSGGGGPTE